MLTEILILLCAAAFIYLSYRYGVGRPAGFPPGPPRVPLFGSYLFMMMSNFKYMHKAVLNFTKWYKSDIVGFYMGSFPVVAVHSAQGVHEVLNNSAFDGRAQVYLAKMRDPRLQISGIFFNDGSVWKEQRRFILRYLRDFGFGRRFNELELVIAEELTDMLEMIRNGTRFAHEERLFRPSGYRICCPNVFNTFSANSLFHIMLNERIPRAERAQLQQLIEKGMQFQRRSDDYGKMLSIMPWIRHIFPNWSAYNELMDSNVFVYKFFADIIDRHIQTYDESSERNFIDMYIAKMKQTGQEKTTTFDREQSIMSLIDFAFPAFTAIGVQLSLLIQNLLLSPAIVERIQREIDDVVGSGRLPTLADRNQLHFTEATVREGLRIQTLVPSDVPHRALADTELMGYRIPKDTIVMISLHAYHADKRTWSDPDQFRPDRFLDSHGRLSLKNDVSLPFGAGKRLCAGETFARNMLFLMTATLCQNFNFVLGDGDDLPDISQNLSGFIISPPDFWLELEERHSLQL